MDNQLTLDYIIKAYMNEKGQGSKHGYQRYLQILIGGLKDMKYDVSGYLSFLKVELGDDQTIPIPDDLLNVKGIYFNSSGRWIPFAGSDDLAMSVGYECGAPEYLPNEKRFPVNNADLGTNPESLVNHVKNGQSIGAYYGSTLANPYSFRVNHQMGVIQLSSNAPSVVILKYEPTAKQVNGQFIVHPYLEEALLSWLRYKVVASLRSVGVAEREYLRNMYTMAKRLAQKRLLAFSFDDFKQAIKKELTATPRF